MVPSFSQSRIKAVLFDLDDTLLGNDMDLFVPAYFRLLSEYAAEVYDPKLLIQHLLAATHVMARDTDPLATNEDVFWDAFVRLTGFDRQVMVPFFTRFYQTRFEEIRSLTRPEEDARSLVEWAFSRGYRVVIATNPMFPLVAVERRLEWARVPASEFRYDLVTSYENMHAVKPHPEYYREILAYLGLDPGEALMIGDDWERDIRPASAIGMQTYWIASPQSEPPEPDVSLTGQGRLADLRRWVES
jgi:HAD superfamily hydrolase (TIGR01549 family)